MKHRAKNGTQTGLKMSTQQRALAVGKALVQKYGFNGFSFQHVADALDIRKPSLFAHFESKEDLGCQILAVYKQDFQRWTQTIAVFEPRAKIGALFEVFFGFSESPTRASKLCPLSALIADFHTLPKSMQKSLDGLFADQAQWLKQTIAEGQRHGGFRKDTPPADLAELIMAIGLGAQLVARVSKSPMKIKRLKAQALAMLDKTP